MRFELTFKRYDVIRARFTAPAVPAMLSGARLPGSGAPFLPDTDAVESAMPYHYRKAFIRARVWWARECSDVVRCDLRDRRGFPLGTVFARLTTA